MQYKRLEKREKEIYKDLDNTELLDRLKRIRQVYDKLEKKQMKFANTFNIACKDGCGTCCEHFNPNITEVEAEFLAYGLIVEKRDQEVYELLSNVDGDSEACPLYNKDDVYKHCTVYKWRPLVCRLFGYAASLDKEGNPVYRTCKYNDKTLDICSEKLRKNKNALVIMKDYGMMIEEIDSKKNRNNLLKDELLRAIDKVNYMIELEKLSRE